MTILGAALRSGNIGPLEAECFVHLANRMWVALWCEPTLRPRGSASGLSTLRSFRHQVCWCFSLKSFDAGFSLSESYLVEFTWFVPLVVMPIFLTILVVGDVLFKPT